MSDVQSMSSIRTALFGYKFLCVRALRTGINPGQTALMWLFLYVNSKAAFVVILGRQQWAEKRNVTAVIEIRLEGSLIADQALSVLDLSHTHKQVQFLDPDRGVTTDPLLMTYALALGLAPDPQSVESCRDHLLGARLWSRQGGGRVMA